jgi:hypothetical protein
MKRIKGVLRVRHNLALKVARDYYNGNFEPKVIEYIFGEKVNLSEEEKSDAWAIKINMEDKTYCESFS